MKSPLTILKHLLLAALLIGLGIGFIFFRVWQKNDRPVVTKSSWNQEKLTLGHDALLNLSISAPWHREIVNPSPTSYPSFLIPVPEKATLTKGSLSLNGKRTWQLKVAFVATDTKSLHGLTASFPIKSSNRISPNSVTLPLPPLAISTPADIPKSPHDPDTLLNEEKPKPEPQTIPEENPKTRPWIWALLLLIPITFLILRKNGVLKATPPWEKALAKLDQLDPNSSPLPFYSKLTDILKQYTSDRFKVRARSKTSAEFIQILKNHPHIHSDQLAKLNTFAKLADAVKFADHLPRATEAPKSLKLIRSFVNNTTPKSDSPDV